MAPTTTDTPLPAMLIETQIRGTLAAHGELPLMDIEHLRGWELATTDRARNVILPRMIARGQVTVRTRPDLPFMRGVNHYTLREDS